MRPAHGYLFTDHSRHHWRVRLFLPKGGCREASGFYCDNTAKLWANYHYSLVRRRPASITWLPTKSVPNP
jgi:hypothetical protein